MTLVEVIAALALLSTLLVGVMAAYRRHADQIRRAGQTRRVLGGVDALLYQWAARETFPPHTDGGELPGNDAFVWRTSLLSERHRQTLAVDIIRLEVFSKDGQPSHLPIVALDLPAPAAQAEASHP